jgi:hypothetical protein
LLTGLASRNEETSEHKAFEVSKKLNHMVRPERFELPTLWFEAKCSIQLSYGRAKRELHYKNTLKIPKKIV